MEWEIIHGHCLNTEIAYFGRQVHVQTGIAGVVIPADQHERFFTGMDAGERFPAPFFNEFSLTCPEDPERIDAYLRQRGFAGGFPAGRWKDQWRNVMVFCATELNTRQEMDGLVDHLAAMVHYKNTGGRTYSC